MILSVPQKKVTNQKKGNVNTKRAYRWKQIKNCEWSNDKKIIVSKISHKQKD